jgi:type I site-specific restriction endonuclease
MAVELKEHNKRPYEKLVQSLNKHNQAVYVSGVGTGKSFIFMKLLADTETFADKKCLYIVPQETVGTNLTTYPEYEQVKDKVDFINMQQFNDSEKSKELIEGYDLIVCDECHHLASNVFGRNILEAVNETNVPFLGLTATPVRMDGVDIRNEFASVVNGISNFDAIRLGLMPQFTYRIGVPDPDLPSYRKRLKKEEGVQSGRTLRDYSMCQDVIKDIAEKYPRDKYIVFSSDIESSRRDVDVIKYAFPNKPVYELYTGSGNAEEILNAFNDANEGVLMTVDMALEGIHLNNVDGIVLFRNVQSIPVFEQILGRVCSIGKQTSPVVIDCSARGVELLHKLVMDNDARWNNVNTEMKIELESLYRKLREIAGEEIPVCEETEFVVEKDMLGTEIIPRDILHIALGSHQEWKNIDEFERAWADADPTNHAFVRNARVDRAVSIYENSRKQWSSLPDSIIDKMKAVLASKCGITLKEFNDALLYLGYEQDGKNLDMELE